MRTPLRCTPLACAIFVTLTLTPAAALAATAGDAAVPADAATELDRVVVSETRQGGYTPPPSAAGTGLALTPRETPQSVSTITRTQLDDFGLDNLNDALESTTGIGVERIETGRTYYTARGFDITNFQFDGVGVPLPYGIQNGDIDTTAYERIEVLRGANGLMSGTGNPSATINFVRKRPRDAFGGSVSATFGSWDRQRIDADVSSPLGSDALRARVAAAYEDGGNHLDRYHLEKSVAHGVAEADLGERTRLSVGVTHQDNNVDSPLWGALPLYYSDGSPTNYDRSTSTAADWSFWDTRDTRAFAELAHDFGNGWTLTGTLTHQDKREDTEIFFVYGTPDRATGLGLFSYPSAYTGRERFTYGDVRASGSFALDARRHDVVFGAGAARGNVRELSGYSADIGTPLPPLEEFDGNYPKPPFDAFFDGSDFDFRRETLYATVRWDIADAFKLITGANHARLRNDGVGYGEMKRISDEARTTPFIGAVWDLSDTYSLYASHGAIFSPQVERDADDVPLSPLEGTNTEAGIKGAWFDDRLNASAAVFLVEQDNLALFDRMEGTRSVYVEEDARSQGLELEVAGQVGDNWSLSAGYTRLDVEDADGNDSRTYVPRSLLRASAVARIAAVPGLRVGGSLRWQDDIHREATLADGSTARIAQDRYAVLGLMAGYRAGNGWEATLNVDNVTDETYIASLYWEQGYYAPPRSVSLTLGYRF